MNNDIKRQLDRLQILLEEWAEWQRGYVGIRGFSAVSPGLHSGYLSKSFEDMCAEIDDEVCRLIDSAVDDLKPGHGAAINKRYGVSAVFRFPRGNYDELLCEAHSALMVTLPKKGVVI